MNIEEFLIDQSIIENGDWVGNIPGFPGARFKVRGLESVAYRHALRKSLKNVDGKDDRDEDGNLSILADDRLRARLYADVILLDWDGLAAKGEPVPYSKETAEKLLASPRFRDIVAEAAQRLAKAVAEREAAIVGN